MTTERLVSLAYSLMWLFTFFRHKLSILRESQAFADNPLCHTVYTNCFEKCTYGFKKVKGDLRDVPKLLRKRLPRAHFSVAEQV